MVLWMVRVVFWWVYGAVEGLGSIVIVEWSCGWSGCYCAECMVLWRVWSVLWWVYSAMDGLVNIVVGVQCYGRSGQYCGVWCCGGSGQY